jgi:hypothetical protein
VNVPIVWAADCDRAHLNHLCAVFDGDLLAATALQILAEGSCINYSMSCHSWRARLIVRRDAAVVRRTELTALYLLRFCDKFCLLIDHYSYLDPQQPIWGGWLLRGLYSYVGRSEL